MSRYLTVSSQNVGKYFCDASEKSLDSSERVGFTRGIKFFDFPESCCLHPGLKREAGVNTFIPHSSGKKSEASPEFYTSADTLLCRRCLKKRQ